MIVLKLCVFAFIFAGAFILAKAIANRQYSYAGHRKFQKMKSWNKTETDLWGVFPLPQLLKLASKAVYVDEASALTLEKRLRKAGLSDTTREYTAKKYLVILFAALLAGLCILAKFYIGTIFVALLAAFFMLKLRDSIDDKIKAKDLEISSEMPGFVRTICRNLQSDRDLVRVLQSYRKVAGSTLGAELDILLAEMQSGNFQTALSHFENRIGTADAFRLCSALRDMSMGIDQTATLSYLADSMAVQAKENIRKDLSLRPSKMRATYYPAIGVAVAMILYVLVVYVINNLNSIL